jgi:hypothetical protein
LRSFQVAAPADNSEACLYDIISIVERQRVELIVPFSEETMYVTALKPRPDPGVTLFSMPQDLVLTLHHKMRGLNPPLLSAFNSLRPTIFWIIAP